MKHSGKSTLKAIEAIAFTKTKSSGPHGLRTVKAHTVKEKLKGGENDK